MKKIILICIAACTVLMLSGCKSADYKKAAELMDNESYEEAIEIFEELGDYKDSADMITACQYGLAVEIYNSGDFKTAIEKFKALDDYEDSGKYVKNAMWEILYDKYPNDADASDATIGAVSSGDFKYLMAIYATEKNDGLMFQMVAVSGETTSTVAIIVYQGKDEADVIGMTSFSATAKGDITETAVMNIDKYKHDDELDWDYSSYGNDTLPTAIYESAKSAYNPSVGMLIMTVKKEFEDNGLGFTLADIGFTSY